MNDKEQNLSSLIPGYEDRRREHSAARSASPRRLILLLTVLSLSNAISVALLWFRGAEWKHPESQSPYSPVTHLIEYQTVTFATGTSEYTGTPSPEMDRRWEDLYRSSVTRISQSDAEHLGLPELSNSGPDEYVLTLDVFHQVHCLDMLRKAVHSEYYPLLESSHVEHCIEHLRQAILCSADVSPIVYRWNSETNSTDINNRKAAPHMCRSFDGIYNWAKDSKNHVPYDNDSF
ncbi:hypothetical protein PM082_009689 [Marasmius tenuissimus]|nr:hypothetical protein PM082_009689 [Marasmius tenuissimus]